MNITYTNYFYKIQNLLSFTCLKKLETVRVTGGKESNMLLEPFAPRECPHTAVSGIFSPNASPVTDPPVIDEAAHEDRLSFRSKDP